MNGTSAKSKTQEMKEREMLVNDIINGLLQCGYWYARASLFNSVTMLSSRELDMPVTARRTKMKGTLLYQRSDVLKVARYAKPFSL